MEESKEPVPEEELAVKRKIACHPMFALLKQTHLSCLKTCMGEGSPELDDSHPAAAAAFDRSSDLDLFMEAYYVALLELKTAIKEPMQEASAFIELMHQLLAEEDGDGGCGEAPVGEEMRRLGINE